MFFKRCSELKLDRTEEFLRIAGALYDPTKPAVGDDGTTDIADYDDEDEIDFSE